MIKKNFPIEYEGETYWFSRSVAVSVLAVTKKDGDAYVLANKRGQGCEFHKGLWNVPGGFIDFDETAVEAARREFYEETGILLSDDLHFVEIDSDPRHSERQIIVIRYMTYLPYEAIEYASTEHSEPGEVEEIKWIRVKDIDKYEWTKGQKETIKKNIND